MNNLQEIKAYATTLSLVHAENELEHLIHEAESKEISYTEFLYRVLGSGIRYRQDKAKERRIKEAGFPYPKYLKDLYRPFSNIFLKLSFTDATSS